MGVRFRLFNDDLVTDKCANLVVMEESNFTELLAKLGPVRFRQVLSKRQKRYLRQIKLIERFFLNEFERWLFHLRFRMDKTQNDAVEIMREICPFALSLTQKMVSKHERTLKKKIFSLFIVLANRKIIIETVDPTEFERELFYWLVYGSMRLAEIRLDVSYTTVVTVRKMFLRRIMESSLSISIKEALYVLMKGLARHKIKYKTRRIATLLHNIEDPDLAIDRLYLGLSNRTRRQIAVLTDPDVVFDRLYFEMVEDPDRFLDLSHEVVDDPDAVFDLCVPAYRNISNEALN